MARNWNEAEFARLYDQYICQDVIQSGGREYYKRYRSRYRTCLRRLAALAPPDPIDVLDIGVGQLALMCRKMWNDRAVVADRALGEPERGARRVDRPAGLLQPRIVRRR